jgi:peroxiredoxin
LGYNFGVGREAPQFTRTAHDGSVVTLKQYRGDWAPVIVFVGSGDAAVDTVKKLGGVGSDLWGFRGQLVGIVSGDAAVVEKVAAAVESAVFPLLADDDGSIAKAYGVWDAETGAARNYAVVVDKAGKIVWTSDGGKAAVKPAAIMAGFREVVR